MAGDVQAMFRAPATAYDRFMGRYARELAPAVARIAGVAAGDRVLDVGCGPGALAEVLAGVVGAERVAAVDPSEAFAAACRARVPGADVRVAPGEALPFPDATFDRALAQLSINFMADPAAGARELVRVTRPGGTVTAAVWDYAEGMVLLHAFWTAAATLDPAASGRDEGKHMRYCRPEALEALWRAAGLAEVAVVPVDVIATYEDFAELWATLALGVGPAGTYTMALPDDAARAALAEALRGALRRAGVDVDAGGGVPLRVPARAWVATGTTATTEGARR